MAIPRTLEFEGVRLRPMVEADQAQVMEWRSNPELGRFMYTDLQGSTLTSQLSWFRGVSQRSDSEYWIIEFEDTPVGVANLADKRTEHARTDWAFYLGSTNVRGKGVGSKVELAVIHYVFVHLRLKKLACQVLSSNPSVVQLHQKFGFEVEGVLKRHFLRHDEWHDVVLLALSDTEARKRGYDRESVVIK